MIDYITVAEQARRVGLSRDRFYELITAGIFPPPAYDIRTRRPIYTPEQQSVCARVRETGAGFNGRIIVFNRMRCVRNRSQIARMTTHSRSSANRWPANAMDKLIAKLAYLGIARVDRARLIQALSHLGVTGIPDEEQVLPALVRHFAN